MLEEGGRGGDMQEEPEDVARQKGYEGADDPTASAQRASEWSSTLVI